MKKLSIATIAGIAATTTGLLLGSAPAHAANLSFTGNLSNADDLFSAYFTLNTASSITSRSFSWGGGTNAAGAPIAAGGFDPILTLFNADNGEFILEQNDISAFPQNLDFEFTQLLAAGNYRAVISADGNYFNSPFPGGNFIDGFTNTGLAFSPTNTSAYAFDLLNINPATTTSVPEPADVMGTVIAGFAAIGLKRKLSSGKN